MNDPRFHRAPRVLLVCDHLVRYAAGVGEGLRAQGAHVALVDRNVDRKNTRAVAEAYLKFLYSPEAQDIIARNFYRPTEPQAMAKYAAQFPSIVLSNISDFGGWRAVQAQHFAEGGIFDKIYQPR